MVFVLCVGCGAELWPPAQGLAETELGGGGVSSEGLGWLSFWLLHWSANGMQAAATCGRKVLAALMLSLSVAQACCVACLWTNPRWQTPAY